MKRKYIVLSSIFLLAIILAVGGYFISQKVRFSADSQIASKSTLINQSPDDLPVIKLDYSKSEIELALSDYQNTRLNNLSSLSQKDKDILAEIDKRKSELFAINKETLFLIKDKNDSTVSTSIQANNTTTVATTRSMLSSTPISNFDFDSQLSNQEKQVLIDAYPKIENVYGRRSTTVPIKVLRSTCSRSYFSAFINEITICDSQSDNAKVLTHELIHAFHNEFVMPALFEEGMTEFVTELVINNFTEMVTNGLSRYEINNVPYSNMENVNNANSSDISPYYIGGSIFAKLYLEDNNFFIKFNSKLYSQDISSDFLQTTETSRLSIIASILTSVENININDWLSNQFAFASYNDKYRYPIPFSVSNIDRIIDNEITGLRFKVLANEPNNLQNLSMEIFDQNNNLLTRCDRAYQAVNSDFDIKPSNCSKPIDTDYQGVLKIKIVWNDNPDNTFTEYMPSLPSQDIQDYGIIGYLAITDKLGAYARLENIDTGIKEDIQVNNGLFLSKTDNSKKQGRYKVAIYDKNGQVLAEKYFNKLVGSYSVRMINLANNCKLNSTQYNNESASADFSNDSKQACSISWMVNGLPIQRAYVTGNSLLLAAKDLMPQKEYNSKISITNGYGYSISQADKFVSIGAFLIVRMENIKTSSGIFSRRLYFSHKPDVSSVTNLKFAQKTPDGGSMYLPTTVNKVNDTTYDITTSQNLSDSLTYTIENLRSLVDVDGGLLGYTSRDLDFKTISITSYDFNCDENTNTNDAQIIGDLWRNGTKIDMALVFTKNNTCKPLGDYLGNLWVQNITEIPINEVTRIGKLVQTTSTAPENTRSSIPSKRYKISGIIYKDGKVQSDVAVTLKDNKGNVISTVTSSQNGSYQFSNLSSGSYTLAAKYVAKILWYNKTYTATNNVNLIGNKSINLNLR
ncbi:MAG: carboxypeptidase regulatory-like domain-containing protein [Patescibacteria group bacterium]